MVHCIHINTWLKYTIVLQKTFLPVRGKQAKYFLTWITATYICTGARTSWPGRAHHLLQKGSKWQWWWWWMLWDCGSLLDSQAHCTAESEVWEAYGPKRGILKGPPIWVTSQHINHILRWCWFTWVHNFSKSKGEPLVTRLLWLWDTGLDGILCFGDEVEWLASVSIHPSLRQRLQNARQVIQGAPNQMHTLMEWINYLHSVVECRRAPGCCE